MKISKADESALVISFTRAIQASHITYYSYAQVGKDWEEKAFGAVEEDTAKLIKSKIDSSLESFFQERVFKHFFEHGNSVPKDKTSKPVPLRSYKGFEEPLELAQEFVNYLKTLPAPYRAYMEVGQALSQHGEDISEIRISDQLSVISYDLFSQETVKTADTSEKSEYLCPRGAKSYKGEYSEKSLFFRYIQSGHFSDRWEPRLVADMADAIRAFYGVLIASGTIMPHSGLSRVEPYVLVNALNPIVEFVGVREMDGDLKKVATFFSTTTTDKRIKNGETLSDLLKPAIDLFSSSETRRLSTSAIWLLRSYISERGMDEILASAIAVEVLLGDRETSDRIGLSKLMANRCAYALSSTFSERKEISDFFVKWYKVRSEIVHSGRMRISGEENKVVKRGTQLASRVLLHEIKVAS